MERSTLQHCSCWWCSAGGGYFINCDLGRYRDVETRENHFYGRVREASSHPNVHHEPSRRRIAAGAEVQRWSTPRASPACKQDCCGCIIVKRDYTQTSRTLSRPRPRARNHLGYGLVSYSSTHQHLYSWCQLVCVLAGGKWLAVMRVSSRFRW
jgi:hypothetical protein